MWESSILFSQLALVIGKNWTTFQVANLVMFYLGIVGKDMKCLQISK